MATALAEHGVSRDARPAVLMGKCPELVVTLLAIWRVGAVQVPLFTAFAGEAIAMRLGAAEVAVVVTNADQRPKLDALAGEFSLDVLEIGPELDTRVSAAEPHRDAVAVDGAGPLVHLFTSGTTGKPKAVPVPVRALTSICPYTIHALDIEADNVLWNAADPGWAYGLYYGILGPLAIGMPNLLVAGGFSAEGTRAVIDGLGVTNFASAPTVYRSLRQAGVTLAHPLRRASSAGEPLNPDVCAWALAALGVEVRNTYGSTERGMVIANRGIPTSAGRSIPARRARRCRASAPPSSTTRSPWAFGPVP